MSRRRRVQPGRYEGEQRATLFWLDVDIRGVDECWPWRGYTEQGYGRYFDGVRMRPAHELALSYFTGEARPVELDTCHSCHNRGCCNPRHLRFDVRQGNVDDSVRDDRHARGSRNGKAKINEEIVLVMRERRAAGATGRDLAAQFGVSEGLVNEIVRGRRWRHVGGPIRSEHGNIKHGRYAGRN